MNAYSFKIQVFKIYGDEFLDGNFFPHFHVSRDDKNGKHYKAENS